jgi:hypothetical protein
VFAPPGTVLNNYKLIEKCSGYELLRFRTEPKHDHVYYVVDAKNLWDIPSLGLSQPQLNESPSDFWLRACDVVRKAMTARARGDRRSDAEWDRISSGFHPCVLMWERESLVLPVADGLGLGEPEANSDGVRKADGWVADRFKRRLNEKYSKAVDGKRLLTRIASSSELMERVLNANASLREIVALMVALEE